MDFHYIGVPVLYVTLPLTSEELHWSSFMMVLPSHYHELSHSGASQEVKLYSSFLEHTFWSP